MDENSFICISTEITNYMFSPQTPMRHSQTEMWDLTKLNTSENVCVYMGVRTCMHVYTHTHRIDTYI